jgi:hypothetical protein
VTEVHLSLQVTGAMRTRTFYRPASTRVMGTSAAVRGEASPGTRIVV